MADTDRLHTLAHACIQAAVNVDDTDTAAMRLRSAYRFLERTNPELAGLRTDVQEFNRRQMFGALEH